MRARRRRDPARAGAQTEITSADGVCTGIRLRKCLRVKNDEGRFAPVFDDEQTEETACTTVLYCIGQKADWRTLLTGTAVELRPNGTAVTDPVTPDRPPSRISSPAATR